MLENKIEYIRQFADWVAEHRKEWRTLCGVSRESMSTQEFQDLFADLNALSSINILFVPLLHVAIYRVYVKLMLETNKREENDDGDIWKQLVNEAVDEIINNINYSAEIQPIYEKPTI